MYGVVNHLCRSSSLDNILLLSRKKLKLEKLYSSKIVLSGISFSEEDYSAGRGSFAAIKDISEKISDCSRQEEVGTWGNVLCEVFLQQMGANVKGR
ncbi:hypothetical protein Acr_08g0018480 [Actinidia rufa]|uniref:Uncharacterized protein n=1 Tax=Actinidia rufa TaxID=165716 RepID=A0A7J0F438_9ERIC|nr:hypothetical protein Acr_08g0018480 [Actinidia rufa]